MAHKTIMMRRYTFDKHQTWMQRIVECASWYRRTTGQVPTIAHVALSAKDAPAEMGVVRIERAWGVGRNEIDLGVEPAVSPLEAQG
jgi:hypothetical protein